MGVARSGQVQDLRRATMEQIFDFRFPIDDLWVYDAFYQKRPTPIEFRKSAIKNRQSTMYHQFSGLKGCKAGARHG
ncbi:MAG: hypothetical protein DRP64_08925 [Verrucomicrobia bacterium]|nr:MAG: hypothetical protein DRP64_08925 [Verrucomicrobiota bacterium]